MCLQYFYKSLIFQSLEVLNLASVFKSKCYYSQIYFLGLICTTSIEVERVFLEERKEGMIKIKSGYAQLLLV